jgi:hypothetical protein
MKFVLQFMQTSLVPHANWLFGLISSVGMVFPLAFGTPPLILHQSYRLE